MKGIISLFALALPVLAVTGLQAAGSTDAKNVAIFLYDGVEILDFSGPGEVFAATSVSGERPFNVYTVAATEDAILSQGFVKVVPEFTIESCPEPDIMVLPGGNTGPSLRNSNVIAWIKNSQPEIALSVCTGAFLLAKAGLLEGKKATTWHGAIERFRQEAPNTEVFENTRFVDNGKVVTTAGVSAGIDGALHVVSRLLGEDVAKATARYMEYDKWVPEAGHVVETEALLRLRRGEPVEAETINTEVYPGDLRNLGHDLMAAGRSMEARRALELALELEPGFALSHLDLGKMLEATGDEQRANEHFLHYLEGLPGDLEVIDKVRFAVAMQRFDELAQEDRLNERGINVLGYRLMAQDRMQEAIQAFELNVKAHPDSWNAYDSLGDAWAKNGGNAQAIRFYQKSLELNPQNTNARDMIEKLSGTH